MYVFICAWRETGMEVGEEEGCRVTSLICRVQCIILSSTPFTSLGLEVGTSACNVQCCIAWSTVYGSCPFFEGESHPSHYPCELK